MKLIPITINSYEDLRQAIEVLASFEKASFKKKPGKIKEKNDFEVLWGILWGVLWLSPEEELISPKVFQLMLTEMLAEMLAENSSFPRILHQQSLYDCADSEARTLQALICGSKRIIYNGMAFTTLKQLAAGYNASLQKNRPHSFIFDARARNSSRLLYSYIKNNLLNQQIKLK